MASVSSKYHLSALLMVRFSGTRTCHWGEGGARGTSLGRQRGRAPQGARSLTSPTNPRLADRFVVRRTPNCCYPPNAGTGLRVLGGLCARLAGWRLRCPRDSLPCLLPAHGHRDCARTYARATVVSLMTFPPFLRRRTQASSIHPSWVCRSAYLSGNIRWAPGLDCAVC